MNKNQMSPDSWFRIKNPDEVISPALLIYPDRVENNISRMISIAGDSHLLQPHVKTHKMPEVVRLHLKHGIKRFKCATIAEAEMVAGCGAEEILLAYQPVGPNIIRFFELRKKYPQIKISCIADCESIIMELSGAATTYNTTISIWLDINNGMNRTGVIPGDTAVRLYRMITDSPLLIAEGLHVYDGHIHDKDHLLREKSCNEAFSGVKSLISEITGSAGRPIRVVAGGTPTFPIHAKRKGVGTSPGTAVLWDYGYSSSFRDMDFLHSALLITRVISKPAGDLICIDLGTKAVASEMPHPRINIMNINSYEFVSHNEEHMVIRTPESEKIMVGDVLYCIPYHICPTVDRHDKVSVVRNGKVTEQWTVMARKRKITI